jgi:hypothetical protein
VNRFNKTDYNTVTDKNTGLEWQADATESITWREAMDYAERLGDGWRLPTIEELLTLIDYSRSYPATNFPNHPASWFWSSSVYAYYANSAWIVDFLCSNVGYYDKNYYSHVRCVRRGPSNKRLDSLAKDEHIQKLETERDEARAEVERLRGILAKEKHSVDSRH